MPDSLPAPHTEAASAGSRPVSATVVLASDNSATFGRGLPAAAVVLPLLRRYAARLRELSGLDAVPLAVTARDAHELIARLRERADDVSAVFLTSTDPDRAQAARRELGGPDGVPVITDHETTAVAVVAALLTELGRIGVSPQRATVVVAGAEESPELVPLLVATGVGDLIAWNPWSDPRFPLPRVAAGAHAVLDVTGVGVAAALTGPPVITPEPAWALLALPGLLSALVRSPAPPDDLLMTYDACARALAVAAGPGERLPRPADAELTAAVAAAAHHALRRGRLPRP